jgi:hypothetical protein
MSFSLAKHLQRPLAVGVLACLSAFASAAFGADKSASAPVDGRYQKERAVCDSGLSNQDRATCLKEAGAAKAEARQGRLSNNASPQTREVNAVDRCQALPTKDQADCMARIDGPGTPNQRTTTSGSVAGGGILRETVTTVPGKAASASDK